jgi:hypothetical protein
MATAEITTLHARPVALGAVSVSLNGELCAIQVVSALECANESYFTAR